MSDRIRDVVAHPEPKDVRCSFCDYFTIKNGRPFCKRDNFVLKKNWAPTCREYTIERKVRITGEIFSSRYGMNITKLTFTYNVDKDVSEIDAFDNSTKLFTLKFSYDGDKNVSEIERVDYK